VYVLSLGSRGEERRSFGKIADGDVTYSQIPEEDCLDPVRSMDSREKRIVVFVSSTFRDMFAERDELTLRIFPELRAICESRGIVWGEVDFRWGIPEEKGGQLLEICLDAIDRCRPCFIGMLGERYGTTDADIPKDLDKRFPNLFDNPGRSVTEIEIRHAVLNNPEAAENAFFYFRDPAYIETLPEDQRADFHEDPSPQGRAGRQRLAALKEEILISGRPVREYKRPIEIGQLIRADMMTVIDKLAPRTLELLSDKDREIAMLDREEAAHDAFARSRFGVYVPRQAYFDQLDAHADDDGLPLVVKGESGAGKSALLAHWTDRHGVRNPDLVVIRHFVGATSDSADLTAMLRRFMGEFRRRLGVMVELPADDAAIRAAFPSWLAMAAAKGRVVLVIDALNHLGDLHGALDLTWLPLVMPAGIRLIVSTLPGRLFEAIRQRNWLELIVEPLTFEERKKVIRCYLHRFFRELSPSEVDRIAAAEQTQNPLFLRAVLEELRVHGRYSRLPDQITAYLKINTIPALFEAILARYEHDYERDRPRLVRDLCRYIWASRRGLSHNELKYLLGYGGRPIPDAAWAPFLNVLQYGLVEKGNVLTFFHDYLREAVRVRYLPIEDDAIDAHLALYEFFKGRSLDLRQVAELPWQLAAAGEWGRLIGWLTEPVFFAEVRRYHEFDILRYWTQIEKMSPFKVVEAYSDVVNDPSYDDVERNAVALLIKSLGHSTEAGAIWERMMADIPDPDTREVLCGNLALVHQTHGEFEKAMMLLNEQERICRESGNLTHLQLSLSNQAVISHQRGDHDGAKIRLKEAEKICLEIGHVNGLAASLGNQALILRDRGDLDGAMILQKRVEQLFRDLGNVNGLQQSLGNQALILRAQGNLQESMHLLKKQEQICREHGFVDGLQTSLTNQALILRARGDLEEAMNHHREAERICREFKIERGLAISLGNQAALLLFRGDLDNAMELLKEQERICLEIGLPDVLQRAYGNQAQIHLSKGDSTSAAALFEKEERICRGFGFVEDLAISLQNQACFLVQQDRRAEALQAIDEAYILASDNGFGSLAKDIRKRKDILGL